MKSFKNIVLVVFLFTAQKSVSQNIDIDILKGINPQYPTSTVWKATSGSVDWTAGALSLGTLGYGLIKKNKNIQQNGYELIMTAGIDIAVTQILKKVFNRTRPEDKYPGVIFPATLSHDKSFPSGHTSLAFSMATTLTLQYKKWYVIVPAYLWASSVGYSRMYLGKHYPSDVLAGAVLGTGSSWLSYIISNKLFKRKKQAAITKN